MKTLIKAIILVCFVSSASFAATTSKGSYPLVGTSKHTTAIREHTHEYEQPEVYENTDHFKTGAYLQAVLWESKSKNVEVGSFNTWLNETNEFTSLLGVKVYLNRMSYQK